MTTFEMLQSILLLILTAGTIWLAVEFKGFKTAFSEKTDVNNETIKLQLQAYERLALFVERCSLKNLVGRIAPDGLSAAEMQGAFIQTLKTEYDYNISQQIYIKSELWRAVSNFKEQNIYIINQVAAALSNDAAGIQLSKSLLELLLINEKADLNSVVLEALQFEAKKLL
jgi:hypothetical protein